MKSLLNTTAASSSPDYVPGMIEAESPLERVRASGITATGDNYPQLAELVVAEFRKVFVEISDPGFSWDIEYDLEGADLHLQVYLTHANGLPGCERSSGLPPLDHPSNAMWEKVGMWDYGWTFDKHSRVGNHTEVRMWMVNLDEQFSA